MMNEMLIQCSKIIQRKKTFGSLSNACFKIFKDDYVEGAEKKKYATSFGAFIITCHAKQC